VSEGTLFDAAWDAWRQDITDSLLSPAERPAGCTPRLLMHVGAIDPDDACVRREWALGVMTADETVLGPLRAAGLREQDIHEMIALLERHPTPAAGG
jgi:hypothetical protein